MNLYTNRYWYFSDNGSLSANQMKTLSINISLCHTIQFNRYGA